MSNLADKAEDVLDPGKESIKSALRKGNGLAKEKWQDTLEGVRETFVSAKETAREVTGAASGKAKKINSYLAGMISRHPWKAVAIVALGTLLLGRLSKK